MNPMATAPQNRRRWFQFGRPSRRRLTTLIAVGAVAVSLAVAYLYFWLARPIGEGPAGPAVARAEFNEPWTDRRVLLLGIGDSVTAGLGARSPDHSYFERLAQNPQDEFPELRGVCLSAVLPNLQKSNRAISGSTSLDHLHVIEENLSLQSPNVFGLVVMTTGGNDLIHSYGQRPPREGAMYGATLAKAEPWIANFEQRLAKMLDLVDQRFPGGCHVFLADIYDPTDGVGDAPSVYLPHWSDGLAIHAAYNKILHNAANNRRNVTLVPLHAEFLGHGAHCRQFWRSTYRAEDPYYWFYDNIEDPNDRGYDAIRRVFLNTMVEAAEQVKDQLRMTPAK
jgi:lysophospholipase L1-like esterase